MKCFVLALVAALLLAGCAEPSRSSGRPAEKVEPLVNEGDAYETRFLLHEHRGLGLSTYVPEGLIVEIDENGIAVYAQIGFSGRKFDRTQFRIFSGGPSLEQTEERIVEHFKERNVETEAADPKHFTFAASLAERNTVFDPENMSVFGGGAVLRNGDRYYGVVYHYTGEMGDGFHPIVMKAMEELRWFSPHANETASAF